MIIHAQQDTARSGLFDAGWKFYRGNVAGAEQEAFDDAAWRPVSLPHDWSIEDIPGTNSPFAADSTNGVSGGFTMGGIGWYRKQFTISSAQKEKTVYIQFDGVYMNADIWLNGVHLGNHPYGYTTFRYNVSDKLHWDKPNTIVVQVKNEGRNSRWYSGSGIYRHVWLQLLKPVHIAPDGIYITTPQANASMAVVAAKATLANESGERTQATVTTRILDQLGREKGVVRTQQVVMPHSSAEVSQQLRIQQPRLWSVDAPALYTLVTEVTSNRQLTDRTKTKFGIRTLSFDAKQGFRLNGTTLKLKGGCVHHDNGPLGAKAYDRAEERKVELLKASGYNAIRCAHNPPSPAFLDACDRLGMLVIDEAFDMWKDKKNGNDYHLYFSEWWQRDVESMVLRDRNHPSIIMWSTGNEIPNRDKPEVVAVAKMLADHLRKLDPTRPVTCGVNGVEANKDPFFATLDVAGYNYALDKYKTEQERIPNRVVFATESFPLDAFDYWMGVVDNPHVIGDFVWTSYDYIGEASIGWLGYPQSKNFFPWNLAYCGDIDVCGWKRPQSYYRDALWKKDQLSLFVKPPQPTFKETNPKLESWSRWNWPDVTTNWSWKAYQDTALEVTAYASCNEVELFLNGKSLGKKPTNRSTKFLAAWQVPYTPGTLKAVGYTGGKEVASSLLQTSGEPVQLRLKADKTSIAANDQDLSYITVELADANGVRHPIAENLVQFTIDGPGTIVGVGNANPKSTESCTQPRRTTWQGRCLVIVKAGTQPGGITVKATAEGMKPATVTIRAN